VRLTPRYITLLAALCAGIITDCILFIPSLHFAYHSVRLHGMLETAATLIALLATFLLWGRLKQRRGLPDLLMTLALGLLALTNLFFALIPAVLWSSPRPFSTWTTLAAGGLGAAMLAAAAVIPERPLRDFPRAVTVGVALSALALAAIGLIVANIDVLPVGVDPSRSPARAQSFVTGNGVIVVTQLVIGALFAVAAVGATKRAERGRDELLLWLGAGAAVAAVARVNYFIFPSLYSEWVYTGDALRLGFYILLLVGAAREIGVYQRAHAEARVLEERRRIARNLHDGLAQELAFIVAATREFKDGRWAGSRIEQLASAAERGLDESRRAIARLAPQTDERFDLALIQTIEDVAQRLGARVSVQADAAPGLAGERQEELLRIAREAVTNAVRHGSARQVQVRFTNGNGVRLSIEDDGTGFDPEAIQKTGFGLTSMRERATTIGGTFRVTSTPSVGTEIEVTVP
jgi:signal transduction histidine kinase